VSIAGEQLSTAMLDYGECPEAVILQLEDPLRIIKRSGPLQKRHWLELQGHHCFKNSTPSMEPIPNEVEKTKQRNSDQDERHEEGPIVFWFSVHAEKLGSIVVGLCRCLLQICSLRTSRKCSSYPEPTFSRAKFFKAFDG